MWPWSIENKTSLKNWVMGSAPFRGFLAKIRTPTYSEYLNSYRFLKGNKECNRLDLLRHRHRTLQLPLNHLFSQVCVHVVRQSNRTVGDNRVMMQRMLWIPDALCRLRGCSRCSITPDSQHAAHWALCTTGVGVWLIDQPYKSAVQPPLKDSSTTVEDLKWVIKPVFMKMTQMFPILFVIRGLKQDPHQILSGMLCDVCVLVLDLSSSAASAVLHPQVHIFLFPPILSSKLMSHFVFRRCFIAHKPVVVPAGELSLRFYGDERSLTNPRSVRLTRHFHSRPHICLPGSSGSGVDGDTSAPSFKCRTNPEPPFQLLGDIFN